MRPIAAVPAVSIELEAARDSKGRLHVAYMVPPADGIELLVGATP